MAASPAPDRPPIRIEPLSPAVGLWVDGPDLHQLDAGLKAMIEDLWQLGGALLFRHQRSPEDAARVLASVLAKGPVAVDGGTAEDTSFGGDWAMPGSHSSVPPNALIFCAGASDTPLAMAGMEAAADALQMAEPDLMAQVAGVWVAHTPGGPEHPLLHRHPLSGEVCFYAPPPGETAFPGSAQLLAYLEQPVMFISCVSAGGIVWLYSGVTTR